MIHFNIIPPSNPSPLRLPDLNFTQNTYLTHVCVCVHAPPLFLPLIATHTSVNKYHLELCQFQEAVCGVLYCMGRVCWSRWNWAFLVGVEDPVNVADFLLVVTCCLPGTMSRAGWHIAGDHETDRVTVPPFLTLRSLARGTNFYVTNLSLKFAWFQASAVK